MDGSDEKHTCAELNPTVLVSVLASVLVSTGLGIGYVFENAKVRGAARTPVLTSWLFVLDAAAVFIAAAAGCRPASSHVVACTLLFLAGLYVRMTYDTWFALQGVKHGPVVARRVGVLAGCIDAGALLVILLLYARATVTEFAAVAVLLVSMFAGTAVYVLTILVKGNTAVVNGEDAVLHLCFCMFATLLVVVFTLDPPDWTLLVLSSYAALQTIVFCCMCLHTEKKARTKVRAVTEMPTQMAVLEVPTGMSNEWARSVRLSFRSEKGIDKLMEEARGRGYDELVLFLRACNNADLVDKSKLHSYVDTIMDVYVRDGASKLINVDYAARNAVLKAFDEAGRDITLERWRELVLPLTKEVSVLVHNQSVVASTGACAKTFEKEDS